MRKYENNLFLLERAKIAIYEKQKRDMEIKSPKTLRKFAISIARYFAKSYDKGQLYPIPKKKFGRVIITENNPYIFNNTDYYTKLITDFGTFYVFTLSQDKLIELIESNLESWGYPKSDICISASCPSYAYRKTFYISCTFE